MTEQTDRIMLCGPPKGCTCPAVAWSCCCEASVHGRHLLFRTGCDCWACTPEDKP